MGSLSFQILKLLFERDVLQSIQGREGSAGTPHTQLERSSIWLHHDPQYHFVTILAKIFPILIEFLPSDNKSPVVASFL